MIMESPTPELRSVALPWRPVPRVATVAGLDIWPPHLTRRQIAQWKGLSGEIVHVVDRAPFESEYRGSRHLLICYERAVREQGESILEDLPPSRQHDLSHKMTFVPAGRRFFESQQPRVPMQAVCIYLDPQCEVMRRTGDGDGGEPKPRLFFENPLIWQTALKLKELVEIGAASEGYAEALGVVLGHELLQLGRGRASGELVIRGGLASWQERTIAAYLEEKLAEPISLATLAEVVRLSPYHFARAFKQSFGMPPHRYHMNLRIACAKTLLAMPTVSVTEVAFRVGFSEASAFTAAFRRCAGRTPTEYRRSLL
jgi:AraC family transcriptional regulator